MEGDRISSRKKEAIINNNNNNNNNDDDDDNNNNNNNFKNALDDALIYQTIESNPQRISKLKPYINKYNWKGIKFPDQKNGKNFSKIKRNCASYITCKTQHKKICVAYRSKHNKKCKKQVILLMIGDDEKYNYLAVTSLSALLQRTSSNHKEDFYGLNCLSSYTKKK